MIRPDSVRLFDSGSQHRGIIMVVHDGVGCKLARSHGRFWRPDNRGARCPMLLRSATVGVLVIATSVLCASVVRSQQRATLTAQDVRKIHDAVYKSENFILPPGTISKVLAAQTGDITLKSPVASATSALPTQPRAAIQESACHAAAVIEGRAVSSQSYLTADGAGIYTEWTFTLLHSLKEPGQPARSAGSNAFVLRRGGALNYGTRTVTVMPPGGTSVIEEGKEYLLFLSRYIAETGAFADDYLALPFEQNVLSPKAQGIPTSLRSFSRAAILSAARDEIAQQTFESRCKH